MPRITMLLIGTVITTLGAVSGGAGEVLVFAAASLADALREVGAKYEAAQPHDRITFSLDASSTLARQIASGAPADVFFSADEAKMNQLQEQGLLVEGSRTSVLSNALVIVTASVGGAAIASAADLTNASITSVGLANPEAVPAGVYAQDYLKSTGLWAAVAPKVVPLENVRAVLAAVEAGNVDAGFVYRTDAAIFKRVRVVDAIGGDQAPSITYPVALIKGVRDMEAARRFEDFLQSPDAAEIFEKCGFTVLKP